MNVYWDTYSFISYLLITSRLMVNVLRDTCFSSFYFVPPFLIKKFLVLLLPLLPLLIISTSIKVLNLQHRREKKGVQGVHRLYRSLRRVTRRYIKGMYFSYLFVSCYSFMCPLMNIFKIIVGFNRLQPISLILHLFWFK